MKTQTWTLIFDPNEALKLASEGTELFYQERHEPKEPNGNWCTYHKITKMISSGAKLLLWLENSKNHISVWRSEVFYKASE